MIIPTICIEVCSFHSLSHAITLAHNSSRPPRQTPWMGLDQFPVPTPHHPYSDSQWAPRRTSWMAINSSGLWDIFELQTLRWGWDAVWRTVCGLWMGELSHLGTSVAIIGRVTVFELDCLVDPALCSPPGKAFWWSCRWHFCYSASIYHQYLHLPSP